MWSQHLLRGCQLWGIFYGAISLGSMCRGGNVCYPSAPFHCLQWSYDLKLCFYCVTLILFLPQLWWLWLKMTTRGRKQISLTMPSAATWDGAAPPTTASTTPAWSSSNSPLAWGTWSSQRITGSSLCLSSCWCSMSSSPTSSCSTCSLHWWGKLSTKLHRRARASGNSRCVGSVRLLSKKKGVGNQKRFQKEFFRADMYLNSRSLLLSDSPEQLLQKSGLAPFPCIFDILTKQMLPVFHRFSECKKRNIFVIGLNYWALYDGKSWSDYEERDYARGKPIFTRISFCWR